MATESDLYDAIKEELDSNGSMNRINAQFRLEVLKMLDSKPRKRPDLPEDTALITELIREFLDFHHYKYSTEILTAESGLSESVMPRTILAAQIGVEDTGDAAKLPLLYGIISSFTQKRKEK